MIAVGVGVGLALIVYFVSSQPGGDETAHPEGVVSGPDPSRQAPVTTLRVGLAPSGQQLLLYKALVRSADEGGEKREKKESMLKMLLKENRNKKVKDGEKADGDGQKGKRKRGKKARTTAELNVFS